VGVGLGIESPIRTEQVSVILGLTLPGTFLEEYRRAWQAFRQGLRDVLFPFGTYQLRYYAGVACASSA
jgi:hypothetical protein